MLDALKLTVAGADCSSGQAFMVIININSLSYYRYYQGDAVVQQLTSWVYVCQFLEKTGQAAMSRLFGP